jgi:hypothetical protein
MVERPSAVELLRKVVLPSVESLFVAAEIDEIRLISSDTECRVFIVAAGELAESIVWSDEIELWNAYDAREKLASEFQDFIAESRFGWGSLRVPQDLHPE